MLEQQCIAVASVCVLSHACERISPALARQPCQLGQAKESIWRRSGLEQADLHAAVQRTSEFGRDPLLLRGLRREGKSMARSRQGVESVSIQRSFTFSPWLSKVRQLSAPFHARLHPCHNSETSQSLPGPTYQTQPGEVQCGAPRSQSKRRR